MCSQNHGFANWKRNITLCIEILNIKRIIYSNKIFIHINIINDLIYNYINDFMINIMCEW